MLTPRQRLPSDRSLVLLQKLAERKGSKAVKGSSKSRPKGRVGSLGGMRQEPTRALLGFLRDPTKTRTNLPAPLLRLFQSVGGLYFPQDHSQRHTETCVGAGSTQKLCDSPRCVWVPRVVLRVRSSASVHIFERTPSRCARCCKTPRRVPIWDHPIGYRPSRGVHTRARDV